MITRRVGCFLVRFVGKWLYCGCLLLSWFAKYEGKHRKQRNVGGIMAFCQLRIRCGKWGRMGPWILQAIHHSRNSSVSDQGTSRDIHRPYFGYDSVTSCGTEVGPRTGVEDLEGKSVIIESADEGTCLGMGRLTIGETGGGERPCGPRVGEGWVSSNRWEADDGEGALP